MLIDANFFKLLVDWPAQGPWLEPSLGAGRAFECSAPLPLGSEQKPIRVGQIGVGHGHATKLAVYRASPDYEVVGVVEA